MDPLFKNRLDKHWFNQFNFTARWSSVRSIVLRDQSIATNVRVFTDRSLNVIDQLPCSPWIHQQCWMFGQSRKSVGHMWLNSTGHYGRRCWHLLCLHLYVKLYKLCASITSTDRFPVPVKSAVKSNLTAWCDQNLSNRASNALTVIAPTTEFGRLFQIFTIRAEKNACVSHNENND